MCIGVRSLLPVALAAAALIDRSDINGGDYISYAGPLWGGRQEHPRPFRGETVAITAVVVQGQCMVSDR